MPGILVETSVVSINVKQNYFFFMPYWTDGVVVILLLKTYNCAKHKKISSKKFARKHSQLLQATWLILLHVIKASLANFLLFISHNLAIIHFI